MLLVVWVYTTRGKLNPLSASEVFEACVLSVPLWLLQLRSLQCLCEDGIFTELEFQKQKEIVLKSLDNLM